MNKEETIKDIQDIINANSGTISEQSAKSIAEALYNAGYRKVPDGAVILTPEERDEELKACNEKQAELEAEIEILKIQNKNLGIAFDRLEAENERLTERLKQVLLSIDTVKEMNDMRNIDKQRKQAVHHFAYHILSSLQCRIDDAYDEPDLKSIYEDMKQYIEQELEDFDNIGIYQKRKAQGG